MSKVTKKAQAFTIFEEELKNRTNGVHDSNKAFRGTVLGRMEAEIGVSRASAATMYNEAKRAAEQDNPNVNLGRDPKKVTVNTNKVPKSAPEAPATVEAEATADEATA
jgi:hypothetical protein